MHLTWVGKILLRTFHSLVWIWHAKPTRIWDTSWLKRACKVGSVDRIGVAWWLGLVSSCIHPGGKTIGVVEVCHFLIFNNYYNLWILRFYLYS
jgi:hypothetical protein